MSDASEAEGGRAGLTIGLQRSSVLLHSHSSFFKDRGIGSEDASVLKASFGEY
jgi:hypothetical protein